MEWNFRHFNWVNYISYNLINVFKLKEWLTINNIKIYEFNFVDKYGNFNNKNNYRRINK